MSKWLHGEVFKAVISPKLSKVRYAGVNLEALHQKWCFAHSECIIFLQRPFPDWEVGMPEQLGVDLCHYVKPHQLKYSIDNINLSHQ